MAKFFWDLRKLFGPLGFVVGFGSYLVWAVLDYKNPIAQPQMTLSYFFFVVYLMNGFITSANMWKGLRSGLAGIVAVSMLLLAAFFQRPVVGDWLQLGFYLIYPAILLIDFAGMFVIWLYELVSFSRTSDVSDDFPIRL